MAKFGKFWASSYVRLHTPREPTSSPTASQAECLTRLGLVADSGRVEAFGPKASGVGDRGHPCVCVSGKTCLGTARGTSAYKN